MRRRGDDDRAMNACFDANYCILHVKLLHIIVLIHLSYIIFKPYGSRFMGRNRAGRNRTRIRGGYAVLEYAILRAADAGSILSYVVLVCKPRIQAELTLWMGFQI
jgi:hypothetical protein